MLSFPDFKRLIRPITNKIFLLLARAVLELVDNDESTQKIQVTALADETITGMERFQEYGFETYPKTGAEVFVAFLNGNRDHGIAICTHDSRYRPTDLDEGDVCIYTYRDKTFNHRILLKANRDIEIICKDLNIQATGDISIASTGKMELSGNPFSHN